MTTEFDYNVHCITYITDNVKNYSKLPSESQSSGQNQIIIES